MGVTQKEYVEWSVVRKLSLWVSHRKSMSVESSVVRKLSLWVSHRKSMSVEWWASFRGKSMGVTQKEYVCREVSSSQVKSMNFVFFEISVPLS